MMKLPMVILWEEESLNDREKIFEYLYLFNPQAAESTSCLVDNVIEQEVASLQEQPLMGVQREGVKGRLLIIPEVSMIVSYVVINSDIKILRVLHQKQQFPAA